MKLKIYKYNLKMQIEVSQEQKQQKRKILLTNCKKCKAELRGKQRQFCSKRCKNSWNNKYLYKDKYTVIHRSKNPENFLKALLTKKSRNRKLKIEDVIEKYNLQNGKCAISGREMTFITGHGVQHTNISIDKINPLLGYEKENIQLVCRIVNTMKHTLSYEELLDWCNYILENNIR